MEMDVIIFKFDFELTKFYFDLLDLLVLMCILVYINVTDSTSHIKAFKWSQLYNFTSQM